MLSLIGKRSLKLSASVSPKFWRLNRAGTFSRAHSRMTGQYLANSNRDPRAKIESIADYDDILLVDKIRTLLSLQAGSEYQLKGWDLGRTLDVAIDMRAADVVRFLLDKGANPNGWSNWRCICHLAHAARYGNQEIAELLLDRGARPHGSGALWQAARSGSVAVARLLIDYGVDVNEIVSSKILDGLDCYKDHYQIAQRKEFLENSQKGTPLHAAASGEHLEMIEFLLSKGADQDIRNSEGETALDIVDLNSSGPPEQYPEAIAQQNNRLKIMRVLESF